MENFESNSFIKEQLKKAASWARFLSICGFILVGFMLLGTLSMIDSGSPLSMRATLLLIILYFIPIRYLYLFSANIKLGLENNKELHFEKSFKNLASHYKFIGILTIIYLILFIMLVFIRTGTPLY